MKKLMTAIGAAFMICLSSCSDSLLDLNNPNSLVSQNAWETEKDVKSGLTGCYHTLYNSFYSGFNAFIINGQSDEFYSQSPDMGLASYIMLIYPDYDQRWNSGSWQYLYQSVFRCNQVITYADKVEWASEREKNEVTAQARALRGMDYYYLAMLWKKAPIVDWISSPEDQPEESTFEELVEFIEADFKFAAENLPESWNEPGRVNRYFAYSFLGKLYMNSGQWEKARDAFKTVIDSRKYNLVAEYRDNFKHTTENNSESIWEIQNSDENQSMGGYYGIPNDGSTCSYASYREKFLSASPYGWGDYIVYDWMIDMYKDERDRNGQFDTRLRDNIVYPDIFTDFPGEIVYMDQTEWNTTMWGTGNSWCRKYTTDYYRSWTTFYSPINTRILRYADILLSYAECLVETGGMAQVPEAAKYIDMVRERVNLYPLAESVHKSCLNSVEDFKHRLRIEREKEMCFEYDRFFDLRRWGLGTDDLYTAEVKARSKKYDSNFKNGHEWLPIPMSEVNNNPNLTQNDSY